MEAIERPAPGTCKAWKTQRLGLVHHVLALPWAAPPDQTMGVAATFTGNVLLVTLGKGGR